MSSRSNLDHCFLCLEKTGKQVNWQTDWRRPNPSSAEVASTKWPKCASIAGLPDLSWSKHTKTGKIYQMTTNYTKWHQTTYTKWPQTIPNDHKLYQITTNNVYQTATYLLYQMVINYTKQP
jgi:hypothetical protein